MRSALITCFIFLSTAIHSQVEVNDSLQLSSKQDSIEKAKAMRKKTYSMPRKVTIMSAVLPGLGQVHNKHYWKVPLIYAGIGGFTYMFIINNKEYNYYRKNLKAIYDEDPNTNNVTGYSDDNVQLQKVAYRKKRDLAIIGIGIFYLLNIIDANVSAHLKTFDVSDDLSLQIDPFQEIYTTPQGKCALGGGISFKLNFK